MRNRTYVGIIASWQSGGNGALYLVSCRKREQGRVATSHKAEGGGPDVNERTMVFIIGLRGRYYILIVCHLVALRSRTNAVRGRSLFPHRTVVLEPLGNHATA